MIRGDLDYMQDAPPADIKPEVRSRYGDRFKETPAASTYYFVLNTRVALPDDPRVRRAVNYGIDKRALVRLFAGALVPGCSFVPPRCRGTAGASIAATARGAIPAPRPTLTGRAA